MLTKRDAVTSNIRLLARAIVLSSATMLCPIVAIAFAALCLSASASDSNDGADPVASCTEPKPVVEVATDGTTTGWTTMEDAVDRGHPFVFDGRSAMRKGGWGALQWTPSFLGRELPAVQAKVQQGPQFWYFNQDSPMLNSDFTHGVDIPRHPEYNEVCSLETQAIWRCRRVCGLVRIQHCAFVWPYGVSCPHSHTHTHTAPARPACPACLPEK